MTQFPVIMFKKEIEKQKRYCCESPCEIKSCIIKFHKLINYFSKIHENKNDERIC